MKKGMKLILIKLISFLICKIYNNSQLRIFLGSILREKPPEVTGRTYKWNSGVIQQYHDAREFRL
mgnify:CR=1 FL=1